MADKVIYKLKGHEKFPLREGWLNKGLSAAITRGTKVFLDKKAPDVLGVGTNMVKSMRYWMQSCGLLVKEGNKEKLSKFAHIIYDNDPYIEDVFTLWLLHSNLAKNIYSATVWYMFFNTFEAEEFTKDDLLKRMRLELFKYVGKNVTESSVHDDVDVLLNMYSKRNLKNDDPEDKIICPFASLGLLRREEDTYYKMQPDLRKVSEYLVLYELSCMFEKEKSLSIEKIAAGAGSLGALYHLSRVSVNRYLDIIETLGHIRVDRTAGLDVVYPIAIENPNEIIQAYYKQRR